MFVERVARPTPPAPPLAASSSPPLPASLADSDLFRRWSADSLKLYLWLRARARRGAAVAPSDAALRPSPSQVSGRSGYLEVDCVGDEIEQAIDVSKNTVTKLARELQSLGVATFRSDRAGYHFRLGEWLARPAAGSDLPLLAEAFYLEAALRPPDPGG